jgi:hypothetical protein
LVVVVGVGVFGLVGVVGVVFGGGVGVGFGIVIDSVQDGLVGLEIDPNYALYFATDGNELFTDVYFRSSRNDVRSSAMREKFSGRPIYDRRPLSPSITDVQLRNLIAELMMRHNYQPGLVHISDS